jgi:hypothetical protein
VTENGKEEKMISLKQERLTFRYPEVHEEAVFHIDFQRTLRIPDDEKVYSLPPGLGEFPLRHVDDFPRKVPEEWLRRGGVAMPMYQSEAMWLNFSSRGYPFALKVATGKINAVTGEEWRNHLNLDPQDYLVIPEQPWLDGYCIDKGVIRQFIACPMGEGYTAEEQITGAAEFGGIQICAYPMKADRYEEMIKARKREREKLIAIRKQEREIETQRLRKSITDEHGNKIEKMLNKLVKKIGARTRNAKNEVKHILEILEGAHHPEIDEMKGWLNELRDDLNQITNEGTGEIKEIVSGLEDSLMRVDIAHSTMQYDASPVASGPSLQSVSMGLAPGGQMSQEIFEDNYRLDAWDQRNASRCFVHLSNSAVWQAITGEAPPTKPFTAQDYSKADLPWFEYYDPENEAVAGASILEDLKSVLQMASDKGDELPQDNESVAIDRVVIIGPDEERKVDEATF